jgi:hypothetical protein
MTTIYDPHWDQHLRLLVFASAAIANSAFVRRAFLPLFALERIQCTTIAAAKELINDADCLQDVPLELWSIFKGLVSQAPLEGKKQHFLSLLLYLPLFQAHRVTSMTVYVA